MGHENEESAWQASENASTAALQAGEVHTAREKRDIDRFLPHRGGYRLTELRPEHFRSYYAELRKVKSSVTGKPLSEHTAEGVCACICGILSDVYEPPMTPSTFTWRFRLILKNHGLPERLNVHSLRRSSASLLIANGADVAAAAGLLGHSQPLTTLDIYPRAFDKNKKAVSRELHEGLEI